MPHSQHLVFSRDTEWHGEKVTLPDPLFQEKVY